MLLLLSIFRKEKSTFLPNQKCVLETVIYWLTSNCQGPNNGLTAEEGLISILLGKDGS